MVTCRVVAKLSHMHVTGLFQKWISARLASLGWRPCVIAGPIAVLSASSHKTPSSTLEIHFYRSDETTSQTAFGMDFHSFWLRLLMTFSRKCAWSREFTGSEQFKTRSRRYRNSSGERWHSFWRKERRRQQGYGSKISFETTIRLSFWRL